MCLLYQPALSRLPMMLKLAVIYDGVRKTLVYRQVDDRYYFPIKLIRPLGLKINYDFVCTVCACIRPIPPAYHAGACLNLNKTITRGTMKGPGLVYVS